MIVHIDTKDRAQAAEILYELAAHVSERQEPPARYIYAEPDGEYTEVDAEDMAYYALKPCGCGTGYVTAREGRAIGDTASDIAEQMQKGVVFESVPAQYVRAHWGETCAVCKPQMALGMEAQDD